MTPPCAASAFESIGYRIDRHGDLFGGRLQFRGLFLLLCLVRGDLLGLLFDLFSGLLNLLRRLLDRLDRLCRFGTVCSIFSTLAATMPIDCCSPVIAGTRPATTPSSASLACCRANRPPARAAVVDANTRAGSAVAARTSRKAIAAARITAVTAAASAI
jgi:hypothetical protein